MLDALKTCDFWMYGVAKDEGASEEEWKNEIKNIY